MAPARKHNQRDEEGDDDNGDHDLDTEDEFSSDDARPVKKPKHTVDAAPKPKSTSKPPHDERETINDEMSDDSDGEADVDERDEDLDDGPQDRLDVHVSSAVKSKLAQDDAEIAALEKKLGLKKGKKLPKAFAEDGLGDLMGDLGEGSEDESRKRKRVADEWLRSKRQKAQALRAETSEGDQDDDEDEDHFDSDEDDDNLDEEIFGDEDDEESGEGSDFGGFDEDEKVPPKKKENPYVAPVSKPETTQPQKYIPPSLRARAEPETESLTRLRRQAQGHLNKLSEANLVSILAEFEKLYRDYPRQHVTSTLINLLMDLLCVRSVLQDTFMVLHAGFIAAVYKIMGMDFGAEIVQRIVETLDADGDERGKFEGKESTNLVSLLSQLYNFHVIGGPLMFDYIRLFLQEITENNTELLLKVIRSK